MREAPERAVRHASLDAFLFLNSGGTAKKREGNTLPFFSRVERLSRISILRSELAEPSDRLTMGDVVS